MTTRSDRLINSLDLRPDAPFQFATARQKNIGLYGEKSDSCRWRFNCTMLKITRSFVHLPVFQLKLASLFCDGTMVINYNLFSFPPVDICSSSYRSFSPDSVSLSRCLLSEIPNLSSSRPTGVTRGKEAVKKGTERKREERFMRQKHIKGWNTDGIGRER